MIRIKAGDIIRAFQPVFPYITNDMVHDLAISGTVKTHTNPLTTGRAVYFFDPTDLKDFITNNEKLEPNQKKEILVRLGIKA